MSENRGDPKAVTRRQFVKTSLAAGAVGAIGAAGALTLTPLSRMGESAPTFDYKGLKVLGGSQAPRGIPLIPVRVNEAGEVMGDPDRLEWYRYCGRNNAPGLSESFQSDNVFRYFVSDQVMRDADEDADLWWQARVGKKVRAADFPGVGSGAPALWRSEGVEDTNPLTVLLIRVDASLYDADVRDEFLPDGVMAAFGTCAHLCCVPTYRISRKGYGAGHWEHVTCFCHGSWYDPAQVTEYAFPPTG